MCENRLYEAKRAHLKESGPLRPGVFQGAGEGGLLHSRPEETARLIRAEARLPDRLRVHRCRDRQAERTDPLQRDGAVPRGAPEGQHHPLREDRPTLP